MMNIFLQSYEKNGLYTIVFCNAGRLVSLRTFVSDTSRAALKNNHIFFWFFNHYYVSLLI